MSDASVSPLDHAASPPDFSPQIYRACNIDLRGLSDDALLQHFLQNKHEPRIYGPTSSTVQALSMRWLRGAGVEIGPGARPTPLYGNATASKVDCDDTLFYGGDGIDFRGNIDAPDFGQNNRGRFDFAIASHVLEHADSFLRALENMILITRAGGVVYLALPDIQFTLQKSWMPNFDIDHHIAEYQMPSINVPLHDRLFAEGHVASHREDYGDAVGVYEEIVTTGRVPAALRFMYHKHVYSFNDWLRLLMAAQDFFEGRFQLVDARYGQEHADCHFVLQVMR